MNRLRRNVIAVAPGLLLTALVVSFSPGVAVADVLCLRTGEVVKGRPVEELSTDTLCVVEDATTGNLRRFRWDLLEPADRERLQKAWGRLPPTIEPMAGHVVTLGLEGGLLDEVRGLLVSETDTHRRMMSLGRHLDLEKARIWNIEEVKLDPRLIWTPEQIVRDFLVRLPKTLLDEGGLPTARGHLVVARYAEVLGDYGAAHGHFREAAKDESAPHRKFARQKQAEMQALLADAEALTALRRVRMAVQIRTFRKARTRLDALLEAHPTPSERLAKRIADTRTYLNTTRRVHFEREAGRQVPRLLRKLVEAKVKEQGLGIGDATAWTRRELPEQVFVALAERMQRRDDVTLAEARLFWDARPRRAWSVVSYGSGTFIVAGGGPRPPRKGRKRGANLPKPPTRDQWWAAASMKQRADWLVAFTVERSGLFEVGEAKTVACGTCEGRGVESSRAPDGRLIEVLCRRCGGVRTDRLVRFR